MAKARAQGVVDAGGGGSGRLEPNLCGVCFVGDESERLSIFQLLLQEFYCRQCCYGRTILSNICVPVL